MKKENNKFNFLTDSKILNQLSKLSFTAIFCILLLWGIDLIFSIPQVNYYFGSGFLQEQQGYLFWIFLWLLMFAQVTIIPIPAMPIYIICNNIDGVVANGNGISNLFSYQTIFFCSYVTSACVLGCIVAYLMGRSGGKKIVKWMAGDEEEFDKWCHILNNKKGKSIYALTVLLPIFPDDLISIVMGSLKMEFKSYVLINIIGKLIGAFFINVFIRFPYINDFFIADSSNGFPWMKTILYLSLTIVCIILTIIFKHYAKKINNKNPV